MATFFSYKNSKIYQLKPVKICREFRKMSESTENVSIKILEELFDDQFNTKTAFQMVLNDCKIKKYDSVSELKKATFDCNTKLQKFPYELDIFIQKLTISLVETVNLLKKDFKTGKDLSIMKKHETLTKLVKEFNEITTQILDDDDQNSEESTCKNKETVKVLKQLNIVRENLELSIATLKDFNKLVNGSNSKQMVSVSSMENELKSMLNKDSSEKEPIIAKMKQYKDILKQLESFYVTYVNLILNTEASDTTQQLEQLVIS